MSIKYPKPIEVDPFTHHHFETTTSIKWLNETKEIVPDNLKHIPTVASILIGGKDESSFYQSESMQKQKRAFFSNVMQDVEAVDLNIAKDMTANQFGLNPQEAIRRWQNLSDAGQGVLYDMETLGGLPQGLTPTQRMASLTKGGISPVEVSFVPFDFSGNKLKHGNVGDIKGIEKMFISPSEKLYDKYSGIIQDLSSSTKQMGMQDADYYSMVSLMNYSDEAKLKQGFHTFAEKKDGSLTPGLSQLFRKQWGKVDLTGNYEIELHDGTVQKINPLERIEAGLKNLKQHGKSPEKAAMEMAKLLQNYKKENIGLLGQNVMSFDDIILEKMIRDHTGETIKPKSADLYQALRATAQSPEHLKQMLKNHGIDYDPLGAKSGPYTIDTFAQELLGEKEVHQAYSDNIQTGKVAHMMKPAIDEEIKDIIKKGNELTNYNLRSSDLYDVDGVFSIPNLKRKSPLFKEGYMMSEDSLKAGDEIFALEGHYNRAVKNLDNFEIQEGVLVPKEEGVAVVGTPYDFVLNEEGKVSDSNTIIKSKRTYKVGKQFKTTAQEKDFFGVELIDSRQGQTIHIVRESQGELSSFIHEKFGFVGNFGSKQIEEMNKKALDDLARSRLRKVQGIRTGGGYWGAKKYNEATEKLMQADFINEKTGGFVNSISLKEVQRGTGVSDEIPDSSFVPGLLGDKKEYLSKKDYATLEDEFGDVLPGNLTKDKLLKLDGFNEKKAEKIIKAVSGKVAITETDEALKLVEQHVKNNQEMFDGVFSVDGNVVESMKRDFIRLSPRLVSEHEVSSAIIQNIEKATEDLEEGMGRRQLNIVRGMLVDKAYDDYNEYLENHIDDLRVLEKLGDHEKASFKIKVGDKSINVPLSNVEKTRKNLMTGLSRISKIDGETDQVKRLDNLKEILNKNKNLGIMIGKKNIAKIKKYADDDKFGAAIDELARQLNKQQDQVFGSLKQPEISVENIGFLEYSEKVKQGAIQTIENNIKETSNLIQNVHDTRTDKFFSGQVGKFLEGLDKSLDRQYDKIGLKSEMRPSKVSDLVYSYTKDLREMVGQTKSSMMIFSNQSLENPMMSFAIFDSEHRNIYSEIDNISELRQKSGVAVIDLPLVGEKGTIAYGGQEKIAVSAFVDRVKEHKYSFGTSVDLAGIEGETYINSPVDRIIYELDKANKIHKIRDLIKEGKWDEIERITRKAAMDGMEGLDAATEYSSDDASLLVTGIPGKDSAKRDQVRLRGFYVPVDSRRGEEEIYGSKLDKPLREKESEFGVGRRPHLINKIFRGDLEDKEASVGSIIDQLTKENHRMSFVSNRAGEQVTHFGVSLFDLRDEIPFGALNDPGRPNMPQQLNIRKLTEDFKKNVVDKTEGLRKEAFFQTEKGLRVAENTFDARVMQMNDVEILNKLQSKYEELDALDSFEDKRQEKVYDKLKNILEGDDDVLLPSTSEDQFLVSEEIAYDKDGKPIIIAEKEMGYKKAHKGAKFKKEIFEAIEEKGEYKIGYGEAMYDYEVDGETKTHYFDKKAKTVITDIKTYKGDYSPEYERKVLSTFDDGSKALLSTEKGTMTIHDKDIMNILTEGQKGVHIIAGSDYIKHGGYGDVATGYIKDAMNRIHTEGENKKTRIKEVKGIVEDVFGLKGVKIVGDSTLVYDEDELYNKLLDSPESYKVQDIKNLYEKLNEVVALNEDTMTQEVIFSDVNESFYSRGIDDKFGRAYSLSDFEKGTVVQYEGHEGEVVSKRDKKLHVKFHNWQDKKTKKVRELVFNEKELGQLTTPKAMTEGKGVKISPLARLMLKVQGQDEMAGIVEQIVEGEQSPEMKRILKEEGLGLRQLFEDDLVEEIIDDPKKHGLDKKVNVVRNIEEEFKQLPSKGSKYTSENLKGTILEPNRKGFVLDFGDKEVTLRVGDNKLKEKKTISKLFIPEVKMSGVEGEFHAEEVAKAQRRLYNDYIDYKKNFQLKPGEKGRSQDELWHKVEKSTQNLFDKISTNLGTKSGDLNKLMSERISGGIFQLQGLSEIHSLDPAIIESSREDIIRQIKESASNKFSDPQKQQEVIDKATERLGSIESFLGGREAVDPTVAYMSKERAAEMIGVKQEYFDNHGKLAETPKKKLIEKLKQGEPIPVSYGAYPTQYEGSTQILQAKISDNVKGNNLRIHPSVAGYSKRDFDGDSVALFSLGDKTINDPEIKKALDRTKSRLVEEMYELDSQGVKSLKKDEVKSLVEKQLMNETLVGKLDNIKDLFIDSFIGPEGEISIANAKQPREYLTGSISNLATRIMSAASVIHRDDKENLGKSIKAAAALKEMPISSKFATSADLKDINKTILNMTGHIVEGTEESKSHAKELLAELQLKAQELKEKGAGEVKLSLIKEQDLDSLFDLSEKINALPGIENIFDDKLGLHLSKQTSTPTEVYRALFETDVLPFQTESVKKALGGDISGILAEQEKLIETMTENTGGTLKDPPGKTEVSQNKRAQATIEELKKSIGGPAVASAGKMGFLGKAGLVGAGIFAGAMMSTSPMLPMDDPNLTQPGLQPRGNTQEMSASISQDAMDAFEYNITGNVPSTIDQDPEQLAGMVAQSLGHDSIDINLNSNDNRQEVDKEWIEEYLLSIL